MSLVRQGDSTIVFANTLNYSMRIDVVGRAVNAGDVIYGGTHGVYMLGGAGDDVLVGGQYGDPIAGGAGNDLIRGEGGADSLFGDVGNDVLYGGDGDDVLVGGAGGDAQFGGAGADTFRFTAVSDSPSAGPFDFIHDFQSGTDRIDLTALRTGAGDTLGWLGQDGSTIVFAHSATGDMTIILHGTPTITAADILC